MATPFRWLHRMFSPRSTRRWARRQRSEPRCSWDRYLLQLERLEDRTVPADLSPPLATPTLLSFVANPGIADKITIAQVTAGENDVFTFTDDAETITCTVPGAVGSGTNTVTLTTSHGTFQSVIVDGLDGTDTFVVQSTIVDTEVTEGSALATGPDAEVTVGHNGSVQGILAPLTAEIEASQLNYELTVDDSADPNPRNATINIVRDPGGLPSTGTITGLAPAAIKFAENCVSLAIKGGGGGNMFLVNGRPTGFNAGGFNFAPLFDIYSGMGNDTVNVTATDAVFPNLQVPINIHGQGGNDTVVIGSKHTMQQILGDVKVDNATGLTSLILDDSADPMPTNVDIVGNNTSDVGIFGLSPGRIDALASGLSALTIDGGGGGNTFTIDGTPAGIPTTLNCGAGGDTVNVQTTAAGSTLAIHGQDDQDFVNVGNMSSVQGILGAVSVDNAAGTTALTLDDALDVSAVGRFVSVSDTAVTGLAPARIDYALADLSSLVITGGQAPLPPSDFNTFTVSNTPSSSKTATKTTLNTGPSTDFVEVAATAGLNGASLLIDGVDGADSVTIGTDHTVAAILGPVSVQNLLGATELTLDDSADVAARTVSLAVTNGASKADPGEGTVTGLAPAPIHFRPVDLSSFTLDGGTGGNTFTVGDTVFPATPGATTANTLNTGPGNDTVIVLVTSTGGPLSVHGQGGSDKVTIGNNFLGVQNIQEVVSIDNLLGSTALTLDNAADTAGHTADISDHATTGLAPADLTYTLFGGSSITVAGGAGSDTFNVTPSIRMPFTIHGGLPTPPVSPGDKLHVDVTGVTSPKLSASSSASGLAGAYTFSDRQPVNFDTVESLNPAISVVTATSLDLQAGVDYGMLGVVTFIDAADPDPTHYGVDIAWGDGLGDRGIVTFNAATGTFAVAGDHVYAHEGFDTLTVTVHHAGAPDVTATAAVSVADAPVFLTSFTPPPFNVLFSGHVATFVDYDSGGLPSDFLATIGWSDGTVTSGLVSETGVDFFGHPNFVVTGSHPAISVAIAPFRVQITDMRGGTMTSIANDGNAAVDVTVYFDVATGTYKLIRFAY